MLEGRGLDGGAHSQQEMNDFKHELEEEIKEINKEVQSNPELLKAVKSELGEDATPEAAASAEEVLVTEHNGPVGAEPTAAVGEARHALGSSPLLQDAKQAAMGSRLSH
eukprot:2444988-Amphidinium_carterae.1